MHLGREKKSRNINKHLQWQVEDVENEEMDGDDSGS